MPITLKIPFIGDFGCGKTSLAFKFASTPSRFSTQITAFNSTSGRGHLVKHLKINDTEIQFQLWDTESQERFGTVQNDYFQNASFIVLVFDVTKRQSFENVRQWAIKIKQTNPHAQIHLIGNKIDLERDVLIQNGQELARELEAVYHECSAITGEGVEDIFEGIGMTAIQREEENKKKSCL
ncbi:Rab2a [Hexamita inflata]|uniref:Rab2a n=1 Tax=Hexamita inflata TaxID=28002 RepID=A0ABP1HBX0_9EUKA